MPMCCLVYTARKKELRSESHGHSQACATMPRRRQFPAAAAVHAICVPLFPRAQHAHFDRRLASKLRRRPGCGLRMWKRRCGPARRRVRPPLDEALRRLDRCQTSPKATRSLCRIWSPSAAAVTPPPSLVHILHMRTAWDGCGMRGAGPKLHDGRAAAKPGERVGRQVRQMPSCQRDECRTRLPSLPNRSSGTTGQPRRPGLHLIRHSRAQRQPTAARDGHTERHCNVGPHHAIRTAARA